MRTVLWISVAALIVAFTGCVPSLHPLYTDKDLVYEEKLLGTWKTGPDTDEKWEFTYKGEKVYQLVVGDDKKYSVFKARLVRLGDHHFLDLYPGKKLPEKGFDAVPYVPMHWLARMRLDDAGLRVDLMNHDEVKKLVEKDPSAVKHERVQDGVLLTAPTKELQKFVLAHVAESDKIFAEGKVLAKQ